MTRFIYLLALTASVILAVSVATAAGGTRPDDRAAHGLGSIGSAGTTAPIRPDDRANRGPGAFVPETQSDVLRPDDRAWRGAGPVPRVEFVESPSARLDGFDWTDAGIGATAALGFGLLLVGASTLVRRRHRVAAVS